MHVKTTLLVKGKTQLHALIKIDELLNDPRFAPWSDWSVIGGRWEELYEDSVLSHKTNPDKFMDEIKNCLVARTEEYSSYEKSLEELKLKHKDESSYYSSLVEFYEEQIKKFVNNTIEFDQCAYIYDVENKTVEITKMLEDIHTGATNWHAVIVDFHC